MRIVPTLKRALLFNFILAAVLPVALFALFTLTYVRDYLLEEVGKDNIFLVNELKGDVEEFLQQPVQILRHISQIFYKDSIISPDEMNSYLEREVRNSDYFESIYLLDQGGKVVYLGVSGKLEPHKNDYYSIDLSSHELFSHPFEDDRVFWSDTFISVVTGEPSVTLGMKVRKNMLVGNVSLARLNSIVSRFTSLRELEFAIVDRKGILVAHSNPELALQRVSMTFHPKIARLLESGTSKVPDSEENKNLLESVVRIPDIGWVVWAARSRGDALAPVENMQNFLIFALLVSLVLGAILSILNSRKVMLPVSALVDGTQKLASGDYTFDFPTKSYREINELAAGFRQMVGAVNERETSIAERQERFRNLVNSIEGIVWEFDLEANEFVFVSKHCEEILGCSYRQWLESPDFWKKHIHPDDRQWVLDYLDGLSEGKLSPQFEYRMIDTKGKLLWVRNMVNLVTENKKPFRLYGVIIDITDRKISEIALRDSEIRFRSLVEQAADAIFIHDQQGQIFEVNEKACQSLGYSRAELMGMTVAQIDVAHDPVQFASLWNSVRHGETVTIDGEHRHKNGSTFPVEIRLGSFTFEDRPLFLALVRDVTERRKADAALRESEERYRTVVSSMAEGVILFDRDGQLVASNPSAEKILRRSHEELALLKVDDDWMAFRENGRRFSPGKYPFAMTLKTGKAFENVIMGLKSTPGEEVQTWLEVNTQSISLEGDNSPSGVVATFTDVTEKRRVLKALRDSEEQVRLLLNSTAEGIFGIDLEGRCTFCNPAGLKILGYTDETHILGQSMHRLVHHSRVDGTRVNAEDCRIHEAFKLSESVHSDDEVFWREDGSWFHVEYWSHPISKEGQVIGAVVTFHDITERKLLQQQHIRTAQLASLGELAAGVAHEINNPINGVINYAQILLNRMQKNSLETDLAERIIKEGERIAVIVRDLLFFAREGGPDIKISDVEEVLSEALSLTEAQIRKEGILLKYEIDEDLPKISTRAQQIQQLLLNVLSNARHALNQKYPLHDEKKIIEISIHAVSKKKKEFVRISVKDYGVGIPAAILEKVMNPFVTTKPAGVGTGLGLSISHEIVENHNGEIHIESREGEWTEVTIELPATDRGGE